MGFVKGRFFLNELELRQVSYRAPFLILYSYISGISTDIYSEIKLFTDEVVSDIVKLRKMRTVKLQNDIDRLGCWVSKWGMIFQPVKNNMMQLQK